MSKQKLRPMGDITADMEPLICELVEQHRLQRHEVLYLIYAYMQAHLPESEEIYLDGSKAVLYYGPIGGE